MNNLDKDYWTSIFNLRIIGYILLILSFIDVVNIFIPFQFTNPVWEFQMIGALVEHAPLPLIGSIFVLFGNINNRREVEIYLLNFISWAALLAGILFLLLLPLGIKDTLRIDNQNWVQIANHSSQQITQMQQIKKVLSKATTNQDIIQIIKSLNPQENTLELKNPQDVKSQLLSQMGQLEKNTNNQTQLVQNNTHKELIINSIKWNLGALICSFAFIWIWRITHWVR
jgi:hypothetical protein